MLIAGAGIAGSALATHMGRQGFRVTLFEQSSFPREKPCGEGLMQGGIAALERLDIKTHDLGSNFQGIRYHFSGRTLEGSFPSSQNCFAFGKGLRRRELDSLLAATAARTHGVSLYTGMRVNGPLVEQDRVTGLVVEGQTVRARLVVAADGAHSRVRNALKLNLPTKRKRIGMRMHFRGPAGALAASHVDVFVGHGHELYVTPLPSNEFLVAALAEVSALDGRPQATFRRWWQMQPSLAARLRDAEPISELLVTAPLSGRASRRVLPGLVLLGDAAGFTDPITGGGMTQALQAAESLAQHLATASDWNEETLIDFDRKREAALRDYRLVTSAVLWLSAHPGLARFSLDLMGAMPRFFSHLLGVSAGIRHLAWRSR